MLVLKESSAERDWVVGPRVCRAAEAGRHAVDGQASCHLGVDNGTGSIYLGTDGSGGGELERGAWCRDDGGVRITKRGRSRGGI